MWNKRSPLRVLLHLLLYPFLHTHTLIRTHTHLIVFSLCSFFPSTGTLKTPPLPTTTHPLYRVVSPEATRSHQHCLRESPSVYPRV